MPLDIIYHIVKCNSLFTCSTPTAIILSYFEICVLYIQRHDTALMFFIFNLVISSYSDNLYACSRYDLRMLHRHSGCRMTVPVSIKPPEPHGQNRKWPNHNKAWETANQLQIIYGSRKTMTFVITTFCEGLSISAVDFQLCVIIISIILKSLTINRWIFLRIYIYQCKWGCVQLNVIM